METSEKLLCLQQRNLVCQNSQQPIPGRTGLRIGKTMKNETKKKLTCCICGDEIGDPFGHNAQPLKNGRCCGPCNYALVLPARLKKYLGNKNDM